MTRINANIPVEKLCDEHLRAEHREIKRIPNTIMSGKAKLDNIPDTFVLGTGHVKFFYNKLLFLRRRYFKLYEECINRGFAVTNYHEAFNKLPRHLFHDYKFSEEENQLVIDRISERLQGMKSIRHHSELINSEQAIKLLN